MVGGMPWVLSDVDNSCMSWDWTVTARLFTFGKYSGEPGGGRLGGG